MSDFVAHRITKDLHSFEAQIAGTLASVSRLVGSIAAARDTLGTHPAVGQETLQRFSKVSQLLIQANGETARGHKSLRRDAELLKLPYEETDPKGINAADEEKAA